MSDTIDTQALGRWLGEFARLIAESRDELTKLDSAIGDADHGSNMHRGMTAVTAALPDVLDASPSALLKKVASTLISSVGGASGPLYGTLFLRMASAAGPSSELDPVAFAAALRSGIDGVVARGKAQAGDKTMVDALMPAVDALDRALSDGASLSTALAAAADAAAQGRDATVPMVARKGRASYLGERSVGHADPGATSSALLLLAASSVITSTAGP
jgi:dihydroxyacetone kinase-like protein